MPRRLRITIDDGWFHIFTRGAARRHVFVNDHYKSYFLMLLEKITQKYWFEIHSFCVMGNHYHLLVRTGPDISKAMQFLNSRYSLFFNSQRRKDGPIFRDRFKSILVQDTSYLLNLTRYIHLNPVEAGLVQRPQDYAWSSCTEFVEPRARFPWVKTDILSGLISQNYLAFLNQGNNPYIKDIFSKSRLPKTL